MSESSHELPNDLESLVREAEDQLETIAATVEDVDALKELDAGQRDTVSERLDQLISVVEKAGDLLETVDLEAIPAAVDTDELLEAINTGELPAAMESGETDELVDLRAAVRAINLTKVFDIGNLFEIKKAGGELEGAIDTILEDGEDSEDDGSMLSAVATELLEEGKAVATEELGSFDLDPGDGETGFDAEQMEAYQQFIQQQAMVGIDEFRAAILETHETFNRLYEYNREHLGRTDKQTTSRNPTAVSTLQLERADIPSVSNHSTVPQAVRYSTAPSRRRIYGRRFEQELERKRANERGTETDDVDDERGKGAGERTHKTEKDGGHQ